MNAVSDLCNVIREFRAAASVWGDSDNIEFMLWKWRLLNDAGDRSMILEMFD
jgi:hypothetical protein